MKKLILFLCAALILSSCSMRDNNVLWGKAKYGMTVSEIKSLYPRVTENSIDASILWLWLEGVDAAGVTSDVKFIFNGGKLTNVRIIADSTNIENTGDIVRRYYSRLVKKYGKPIGLNGNELESEKLNFSPSSGVKKDVLVWGYNKTVISLGYRVEDGVAGYVYIYYSLMPQKEGI